MDCGIPRLSDSSEGPGAEFILEAQEKIDHLLEREDSFKVSQDAPRFPGGMSGGTDPPDALARPDSQKRAAAPESRAMRRRIARHISDAWRAQVH